MFMLEVLRKIRSKYIYRKRVKRLVDRVETRLKDLPESHDGLSKQEIKDLKEYYGKYGLTLRSNGFHEFYKRTTGKFDVRFLPEDLYYQRVDRYLNDWSMAKYLDNKTFYPILFYGVRQPKMICYRQNGYWFNGEAILTDKETIIKILSGQPFVFLKVAQNSYGGHGVKYIEGDKVLQQAENIKEDIVVQEPLIQSTNLGMINPSSVNTIRVLSLLRKDGSVKICSMILRMGLGDSKVDNASSGGITIGIQKNGQLKSKAFSVNGISYVSHPTTGVVFNNIVIPNIESVIELVRELTPRFPHFRLISWDIALDQTNTPVLIEANLCDGELDFHQLNNGPVFGKDTDMILKEVLGQ